MSRSRYAPRPEPTPIPASNWNDEPTQCLRVNEHWVGHILGALEVLDQADTWIGTDEQIQAARDNVNEIMAAFVGCQEVSTLIVGEIREFGLLSPPNGWLECNGQSVAITDYPELFAAIGENFGFSVGGNFVLPDSRFRSSVGVGVLSDDPLYEIALGEKRGNAVISIGAGNIPAHNHRQKTTTGVDAKLFVAGSGGLANQQAAVGTTSGFNVTGDAGLGNPFEIIQPVIGFLKCIYAGGV